MKELNLIERSFKIRWVAKFFLLVTGGMASLAAFLHIVTSKSLGTSYGEAVYAIYSLRISIFSLVFASFYSIFILALVTVAIGVVSLLYSHRIAGPMYRLERNLEEVASGDLTMQTRFRTKDELQVLAEEGNAMVRSLNHRVRSAGDALADIEKGIESVNLLLEEEAPAPRKLAEALVQLGKGIEELKRATKDVVLEK